MLEKYENNLREKRRNKNFHNLTKNVLCVIVS